MDGSSNRRPKAPRLAPAALNSVAPVPGNRFARARRNCIATPALIGGSAALRIESLSTVVLPDMVEKAGGERLPGFQAQGICALPQERERGVKRSNAMSRHKCDPRWITIKFKGNAALVAGVPIHPWARLLLPRGSFALLRGARSAAKRRAGFSTRPFDEENNTSM